jgi:glycosyltransferase involved in cell wall biosynthesis
MSTVCLHIAASLNSKHGGPSRSIPGQCDAISDCGTDIVLVSQKLPEEYESDLLVPSNKRTKIYLIDVITRFGITYAFDYNEKIAAILSKENCSLIHSHGLWLQSNYYAAFCARRLQIPHIVSTEGLLASWAFGHNAWKKKPVWYLWQKIALQQATAFCATSDQEAKDIRALGFKQPIAVIPHGVVLPGYPIRDGKVPSRVRTALFLGRIHQIKGIYELVRAWSLLRPEGWKVIIAGPDEGGQKELVQKEILALGLDSVFEFAGYVDGEKKEQLYREADLFILPSFTENFGIAIAEALASGIPVITTKGTPWEGVITNKCGWWIDIGVEPLVDAIRKAISLNDAERVSMGYRAREYVMNEFSWEKVGLKIVSLYDWILKGGTPPDFVRLD